MLYSSTYSTLKIFCEIGSCISMKNVKRFFMRRFYFFIFLDLLNDDIRREIKEEIAKLKPRMDTRNLYHKIHPKLLSTILGCKKLARLLDSKFLLISLYYFR